MYVGACSGHGAGGPPIRLLFIYNYLLKGTHQHNLSKPRLITMPALWCYLSIAQVSSLILILPGTHILNVSLQVVVKTATFPSAAFYCIGVVSNGSCPGSTLQAQLCFFTSPVLLADGLRGTFQRCTKCTVIHSIKNRFVYLRVESVSIKGICLVTSCSGGQLPGFNRPGASSCPGATCPGGHLPGSSRSCVGLYPMGQLSLGPILDLSVYT